MTDDQKKLVTEILNDDNDRFSSRDIEFVENLDKNYQSRDLSPKQSAWLSSLGEKL